MKKTVSDLELARALTYTGGHVESAAALVGLDRTTVYHRLSSCEELRTWRTRVAYLQLPGSVDACMGRLPTGVTLTLSGPKPTSPDHGSYCCSLSPMPRLCIALADSPRNAVRRAFVNYELTVLDEGGLIAERAL